MPHNVLVLLAVLSAHLTVLDSADKQQYDHTILESFAKNRLEKRQQQNLVPGVTKEETDSRSRQTSHFSPRAAKFHSSELSLANAHFLQIRNEYSCQRPRPRLVYMKDLFYSLDKTYVPR